MSEETEHFEAALFFLRTQLAKGEPEAMLASFLEGVEAKRWEWDEEKARGVGLKIRSGEDASLLPMEKKLAVSWAVHILWSFIPKGMLVRAYIGTITGTDPARFNALCGLADDAWVQFGAHEFREKKPR